MPSDVELLRLEIETIWTTDPSGRLLCSAGLDGFAAPLFVIARAADGLVARAGHALDGALAAELEALVAADEALQQRAEPPRCVAGCETRLREVAGALHVACGPSFVVPPSSALTHAASVRTSKDGDADDLCDAAPPEARWEPEEWRMLLAGELGPWAMAIERDQVIATCFSARLTPRAAEAGVWTAAAHRGRGHAREVTAAWARTFEPGARTLFYSTGDYNLASQAVARRLGLREIGRMWQFRHAMLPGS